MQDSETDKQVQVEIHDVTLFKQKSYLAFLALKYLPLKEFGSGVYTITESNEFGNIGEHDLAAGAYAEILSELCNLNSTQQTMVVQAALLHDAGKQKEIIALNTLLGSSDTSHPDSNIAEAMSQNAQYLRHIGISEEIISLAGSNVPSTPEGPTTIEQKIIWVIDAMLTGIEPTDITTRMNTAIGTRDNSGSSLRNQLIHNRAYPTGETLHDVQIRIGERLCREFVKRLNLSIEPSNFPGYLKKLFDKKIAEFDPAQSFRQKIIELIDASNNDHEQALVLGEMFVYLTILLDRFHLQSFRKQLFDGLIVRQQPE
jgi:hypothetical protein